MEKHIKEHLNKEKLKAHGEKVYHKFNEFARETHARHITVKDRHYNHLFTFPATLGIVAALILPVVVGLGLIAFLMNDWKAAVNRREEE